MRARLLLLAVLTVLAAAACGGSTDEPEGPTFEDVFAQIEGLSGQEREQKLVSLAREEGELTLYTSAGADRAAIITEAFEEEYDLDVAVYRATGETIVPRLIEEAEAGFRGADVVRVAGLGMVYLADEGLLERYDSEHRDGLIDGAVHDRWTADAYSTFVVSWNTKLVPPDERPREWEDLADPRWKGRVALEAGDVDWYKTLRDYWIEKDGKSEAEADRLFEGMARNALVVRGHVLLGQLMAAGEVAVGVNYAGRNDLLAADGAPLGWRPPVEPVIPQAQGVGLVRDAKHPAAAVLFVDWLLGKGQKTVVEAGYEAARRDLVVAPTAERRLIDEEALADEQEKWTDRYERLLALGKEAPAG